MARADRVLAVAVGAIVVAAGAAAVVATQRGPEAYDPASPAGVVQVYLGALADHDPVSAAGELADASPCTASDVTQAYLPETFRADLRSETTRADTATVQVRITEGSDGPFGEGWSHDETFQLVLEDGRWRVAGAPWPMGWCEGQESQ
ncbi:hypothetical protein OEB99_19370 [Actinotalea sp. M2MS4P-6]|uniref:hypothetical protein n=1 Tax=Actinotalea sp. M2MS4P-6 TaxID=2983762 RepID=UPI0021E4BF62|nr:hypothetical protein [Actinotalea sp. M2MS4P-6]MCV2396477.1 hypothetical protein [Actinotalea sp. M2MS4P-6]